ncbi:hypothetical protein HDU83_004193 [Entophlyctis luteolus]|nr:hypothetical protein HDU83_004193 [Entophlyctis luteolus]
MAKKKSTVVPKSPAPAPATVLETKKNTLSQADRDKQRRQILLKREIKSLGGSSKDLALVDGVDSDDDGDNDLLEFSQQHQPVSDSTLSSELLEFMKNTLKLDPKTSSVPPAPEDSDLTVADASDFPSGTMSQKQNPEAEVNKKASLTDEVKRQPSAKQSEASDPEVAKRILEMLSSKALDASTVAKPVVANGRTSSVKLLFQPTALWHEVQLDPVDPPGVYTASDELLIAKMYEKAKELYDEEAAKYDKAKFQSASDRNFIRTVLRSGTTTDKISALTLLIQESPLHTLSYLRDHIIRGMAQKRSRRDAIVAVDAVKDLFIGSVLPSSRKLRYFRDQGVLNNGVGPVHLVVWYFEDALKKLYFDFLKLLEELSKDPLVHVKSAALTHIAALLAAKPEQEASLLTLVVNKIGDTTSSASAKGAGGSMASKAAHLLHTKILVTHPDMAAVVVSEVERLLARCNTERNGASARYAALTFLSQIALRRGGRDAGVARQLMGVYFNVFEKIVDGLKYFPTSEAAAGKKPAKRPTKLRGFKSGNVRQSGKRNLTAEQAELEGGVIGDSEDEAEAEAAQIAAVSRGERITNKPQVVDGVDAKTMAVLLTGVNRAFPYAQMDEATVEKHMDVLFKISHMGSFTTSIQALTLIFQVESTRPTVSDRFYSALYDTLLNPSLSTSSKHPMYLNLLHRAIKADVSVTRTRAFIKRIVQVCGMNQTPFICGALFLVGDLMRQNPGLWSLVTLPEDNDDVADEGREKAGVGNSDTKRMPLAYDARKRNPLYSGAELSCLWDLVPFASHFHPTVSLYATTLLSGRAITVPTSATAYDPLQNHTLARFLDRFVYKNPKHVASAYRGSSLMQPRPPGMLGNGGGDDGGGRENLIAGARKRGVVVRDDGEGSGTNGVMMDDEPVNSAAFLRRKREDVAVDEVIIAIYFAVSDLRCFMKLFFYDYFIDQRARRKPQSAKDVKETKSGKEDGGEVSDDEDEVWAAMQRSASLGDDGMEGGDSGDDDDEYDADGGDSAAGAEGSSDDDGDDGFDMEAAMADADAKHARRRERRLLRQGDERGDSESDGSSESAADDREDDWLDDAEDDVDAAAGLYEDEDADASFGGGSESDNDDVPSDGEDQDENSEDRSSKSNGQKTSKPHAGKRAQALADTARRLGYTGDYFDRRMGKSTKKQQLQVGKDDDSHMLDAFGDGFANYDDFVKLIEKGDEGGSDEDTGGVFGTIESQFGAPLRKRNGARKSAAMGASNENGAPKRKAGAKVGGYGNKRKRVKK